MRVLQRQVEALVGGALLKLAVKQALKQSKLQQRKVFLPKHNVYMHYLERLPSSNGTKKKTSKHGDAETASAEDSVAKNPTILEDQHPTIIFCHGLSDCAENLAGFVDALKIPNHIRILIPDQFGHGKDLKRAKSDPDSYQHPTQLTILESMCEFLDAVNSGSNTNVFGVSLGGALAYYLRLKRPDVIQRTVLVSPALECCIDQEFIDDFVQGRKRHMCFEDRNDVKYLFRDLSTGRHNNDKRKRKDPIPKFFLEAVFRANAKNAPQGHFKGMLAGFIDNIEKDVGQAEEGESASSDTNDKKMFSIKKDIDPHSHRLVLWPDHDYICNHDKGVDFFRDSVVSSQKDETQFGRAGNTVFETIPDCGHMFHADGTIIVGIDWVQEHIRNYLLDFRRE
jgi:pimeloyl-ACP methyl ester carboxylesterase